MARNPRFHGLKKPKIRASWNKYNLYNLSRMKLPNTAYMTYFQQKWSAKSLTRAYHGDKLIREKQWQRAFSPNLNAVVPMDHKYLAEFDGSELAEGRGSGKDVDPKAPSETVQVKKKIPYMNMTYAPLERRLDMAIFRSLLASSHKQARQIVVHGHVKVNGQKMIHPGYLLNPGDMYQVEPDVVQHATADRLNREEKSIRKLFVRRANITKKKMSKHHALYLKKDVLVAPKSGKFNDDSKKRRYWLKKLQNFWVYIKRCLPTYEPTRKIKFRQLKASVEKLVANWYEISWKKVEGNIRKIALEYRGACVLFPRETPERQKWLKCRLAINRKRHADKCRRKREKLFSKSKNLQKKNQTGSSPAQASESHVVSSSSSSLPTQISESHVTSSPSPPSPPSPPPPTSSTPPPLPLTARIPKIDSKLSTPATIKIFLGRIENIPIIKKPPYEGYQYKPNAKIRKRDRNVGIPPGGGRKTYPLPWRPKPFMSAFAFIPRYLEVRQNICAGVYLRHPVARPGLSEVPSPFPLETMQLAYNWYLRRR